jgi:hypothetical protein
MPSGSIPLSHLTPQQQAALAREAMLALPHDVGEHLVDLDPGRAAALRRFVAAILPPEGRGPAARDLDGQRVEAMIEARRLIDGAAASLRAAGSIIRASGLHQADHDLADDLDADAAQMSVYLADLDQQLAGADPETGGGPLS